MNLANLLTCSRMILAVLFAYFLFSQAPFARFIALFIFIAAALTDWWDGLAARGMGQTSHFGKLMDPIADKILTLAAFISFCVLGLIPWWVVGIIAAREIWVTVARLQMAPGNPKIAAVPAGKHKTVLQMLYIIAVLLYLIAVQSPYWNAAWDGRAEVLTLAGACLIAAVTLYSGIRYFYMNREYFTGAPPG